MRPGLHVAFALLVTAASARADDVVVKVFGDGRTIFERTACPNGPWEVVCFAPCTATVPRDGWYRLIGARHVAPMRLPADAVQLTLGAPSTEDSTGFFVAAGGLAAIIAGGIVTWFGAQDPRPDPALEALVTGSALAGAGVIALVLGVFIQYQLKPARLGLAVSF